MYHCQSCAYATRTIFGDGCKNCFAFSNYIPAVGPIVEQWKKDARDFTTNKFNNTKKETNMNNVYVTVDGRTYKTIGGTMKMSANEDIELEIEAILAPRYVTSITPTIKDVIFNPPATIVFWSDNTKTVVQTRGDDIYDPEKGLAMAISKKMLGNKRDYYHTFQKYKKKYDKQSNPMTYVGTYDLKDMASMTTDQLRSLGFSDTGIAGFREWAKCEGYEVVNE